MNRHRDSQPSSLELLDVAGRGGQATVWRLADGATHRLSKVYNPDVVVDVELLRVLVAWRGELSDGDAHFLDERSAWPLVVHDHAGQVAFEMTAASADFHENVGGFERVRHATLLFARPDALAGLGVPVPTLELRIAICAELAVGSSPTPISTATGPSAAAPRRATSTTSRSSTSTAASGRSRVRPPAGVPRTRCSTASPTTR